MKLKFLFTLLVSVVIYSHTIAQPIPNYVPQGGLIGLYLFSGNANDISVKSNNGVVTGATLANDRFGNPNSSYNFSSTTNSIIIPPNISYETNNFTISCWVNATSINPIYSSIIKKCTYSNAQNETWAFGLNSPDSIFSNIKVTTCTPGIGWVRDHTKSNTSLLNNWTHLVYNYNTDTLKIYKNGILYKKKYVGTLRSCPGGQIIIGREWSADTKSFVGRIDDIGIWDRNLTQTEISSLYYSSLTIPNDTIWVKNTQKDTLVFQNQIKLSLTTNNITVKNISAYDIKLNYDPTRLKFDSITKTNTVSSNGSLLINSNTPGIINIGWASSSIITSSTLPLLNCYFTPIDSGKTTVSVTNAVFNTDTVRFKYAKIIYNIFNFGDVDLNKAIQSYDASLVLKYSVGIDPLPSIDPLPWEQWRIKIASVDTSVLVDANDASLILKYSVGLITKFPKRGMSSFPGYVTIDMENNDIVVRSFEELGGLNITFLDHITDLDSPTFILNNNALSAYNKQTSLFKVGMAFSEAPINGTEVLRIPYKGLNNQIINIEINENTGVRNYQLNVTTGLNEVLNSNVKIYPNPTNDIVQINGLNNTTSNSIYLYDMYGKLLQTTTMGSSGTLDLRIYKPGVYVLKVNGATRKIIKN